MTKIKAAYMNFVKKSALQPSSGSYIEVNYHNSNVPKFTMESKTKQVDRASNKPKAKIGNDPSGRRNQKTLLHSVIASK